MKKHPSIIRTEYIYALIYKNQKEKAEEMKERFEKSAIKYPYKSDIESERELINYAGQKIVSK